MVKAVAKARLAILRSGVDGQWRLFKPIEELRKPRVLVGFPFFFQMPNMKVFRFIVLPKNQVNWLLRTQEDGLGVVAKCSFKTDQITSIAQVSDIFLWKSELRWVWCWNVRRWSKPKSRFAGREKPQEPQNPTNQARRPSGVGKSSSIPADFFSNSDGCHGWVFGSGLDIPQNSDKGGLVQLTGSHVLGGIVEKTDQPSPLIQLYHQIHRLVGLSYQISIFWSHVYLQPSFERIILHKDAFSSKCFFLHFFAAFSPTWEACCNILKR